MKETLDRLLHVVRLEADEQDPCYPWPRDDSLLEADPSGRLAYLASRMETHSRELFRVGYASWEAVLGEEIGEAYLETDPKKKVAELAQVAAVALRWAQHITETEVNE